MSIKKLTILAGVAVMAFFISLGGGRAWAADLFVDTGGNDNNDCLSVGSPCLTITGAIGKAASSGDTINVAAGTYAERLTINKSLDLIGAQFGVDPTVSGGRTGAESIITVVGTGTPNPDILIKIPGGTTDVTIDGFTLIGAPLTGTPDTSVVRAFDDNITITNNIMDGKVGVLYNSAATNVDGVTIAQNLMTVNKNGVVMFAIPSTNLEISGNTFLPGANLQSDPAVIQMTDVLSGVISGNTGSGFVDGRSGVGGSNLNNLDIYGNSFTGGKDSISIFGNPRGGSTFINIRNNELSDNTQHGINIKGADITITGNDVIDNGNSGIRISRNVIDTERVTISCNNITGNASFGVKVNTATVTEIINAENNWWGAADGPSGVGPGSGDKVTAGVDFAPFRTFLATGTCSVDHFLCYNVAGKRMMDEQVTLKDQFSDTERRVLVPLTLCVPVDKNGEGITDSDTHLVCYEVQGERGERPVNVEVLVTNQFGEQTLRVQRPNVLCVPSTKQVIIE